MDPRRRCLPFADWPEIDRRLWQEGLRPGDPLDDPRHAEHLRPASIEKAKDGYGRWLGFLAGCGALDGSLAPEARVTGEAVGAYLALLRELGNRPYTIVGRVQELQMALRIMGYDQFGWLVTPGGTSLRRLLRPAPRQLTIHHSAVLYDWGIELMDTALLLAGPRRRCVQYRDGLLIAILAARAPRLRSLSVMRLGAHIVRHGDRYRLVLAGADTKTGRPLEYDLPPGLTRYVDRYLAEERRELLGGRNSDAFWVNWGGEPLGYRGIEKRILWRSCKRFPEAFGPHRFRHALSTTAPIADPLHSAAAAAVLGDTVAIVEEHYNRGGQTVAATRLHASLRAERARTEVLAKQLFAARRGRPSAVG